MSSFLKNMRNKKIYVDESKIHLLGGHINENLEDEGGVYGINGIRSGKGPTKMSSDYTYANDGGDDGIYADFTPYGKKKGYLNPLNPNWIQVRGNMPYQPEKSKRYQQVSDDDMPNYMPKSDDEFIRHNGTLYMPTRHKIANGAGDVIKTDLKPDMVYLGDYYGQKTMIPCFNLTKLGGDDKGGEIATMIAHTYKGKEAAYGDNSKYDKYKLKVAGNLIKGEYAKRITELINSNEQMKNFNPDYIVFPQSSSMFNDYIAEFLSKNIYPNAKILPRDFLTKLDLWQFNYNDLIYQTLEYVNSSNNYTKYNKLYSKYDVLKKDFIKETLVRRVGEILSNKLARSLNNIIKSIPSGKNLEKVNPVTTNSYFMKHFDSLYRKEYGRPLTGEEKRRALILDNIWDAVMDDTTEFESAIKNAKLFDDKEISEIKEKTLLSAFQMTFRRQDVSSFIGKFSPKGPGDRTQIYSDVGEFDKAFMGGYIKLKPERIEQIAKSNDTIKNYDAPTRLALKGQFDFNKQYDLSNFTRKDRFIIVDDNYASGASIRNAARAIMELGVPASNIIAMTPGDMGGASSGGKQGAAVPENSAEEYLAYNQTVNHAYDNAGLPQDVLDSLNSTYQSLSTDNQHNIQNRIRAQQKGNLGKAFDDSEFYTEVEPIAVNRRGGGKPYSDEEKEAIISNAQQMLDALVDNITRLTKRISMASTPEEKEYLISKRDEYYRKRNAVRSKIWNLKNNRKMTQGAKDRATIKRKSKNAVK